MKKHIISNIFAYLIIPIYTIFFVRNTPWFVTNFSVIGSYFERRDAFLLWGLIVGVHAYNVLKYIIKQGGNLKKERLSLLIGGILLFCAVTTPYLPKFFPLKAALHEIFAFMSAVIIMLCLSFITFRLYKKDKTRYGMYFGFNLAIIFISYLLFKLVGMVSSALEIFITLSVVWLIQSLKNRLKKAESKS